MLLAPAMLSMCASSTFNLSDELSTTDLPCFNSGGGIVALTETLVNVSLGGASGSAAYTWNLTNGPADALGTSLANYSTVLSLYDPGFTATNMTGTNTTALLYTNFCTSGQASTGMPLAAILAAIELGNLAGSVSNSTNITVT